MLEGFLWAHQEADLAMHSVVGLVLQVGDVENHLVSKARILCSESASRVRVSQPSELSCEADGVAWPDPV